MKDWKPGVKCKGTCDGDGPVYDEGDLLVCWDCYHPRNKEEDGCDEVGEFREVLERENLND